LSKSVKLVKQVKIVKIVKSVKVVKILEIVRTVEIIIIRLCENVKMISMKMDKIVQIIIEKKVD
jgi:hypothetical protein